MSDVQLIKVEVSVPKELADVKDLVIAVARDLKEGKKPVEVAFGALPKLQEAIDGSALVPAELRSPQVYMLGAVLLAELAAIFLAPKAVAAVAGAVAPEAEVPQA